MKCEYCEGDKPMKENLIHRVIGAIRFVRVKRNKWGPCLTIGTLTQYNGRKCNSVSINYCPMCGRKLGENKDEV